MAGVIWIAGLWFIQKLEDGWARVGMGGALYDGVYRRIVSYVGG